jgi:hypothetical protein
VWNSLDKDISIAGLPWQFLSAGCFCEAHCEEAYGHTQHSRLLLCPDP